MFSPTYLAGLAAVILSLQSMSVIAAPAAASLTTESADYNSSLTSRAGGRTDYSIEEIKSMFMKNRNPPADSCYFYVGAFKDAAVARAFTQGKTTLYDVYYNANDGAKWPFNDAADPQQSYVAANLRHKWFEDTSRAYAQVCKGKAYLVWDNVQPLILKDADGNIIWQTIWITDEFDAITKGQTGITSVVRVDPVTFAETSYWTKPSKRGLEEETETITALQEKRGTSAPPPPFPPLHPFPVLPSSCYSACRAAVALADKSSDVEGTVFTRNNDQAFYVPGQCGLHVVQYQKPNPATDDYSTCCLTAYFSRPP